MSKRQSPTKEQMRVSNEIAMQTVSRCRTLIDEAAKANQNGSRSLMDIAIMAWLLAEVMGKKQLSTRGQDLMGFVIGCSVEAYMDWGKLDEVSLTACIAKDLMGQEFLEGGGWLGDVIAKARDPDHGKRTAAARGSAWRVRTGRGAA